MGDYTASEQGEIRADLTEMYRAGRQDLPERATSLASAANAMMDAIDSMNARSAGMGDHQVLNDALSLAAACQRGVARSVQTMNNIAAAVVAIADDFVARDDFARSVFNGLDHDLTQGPVPQVGVPEKADEERLTQPGAGEDYAPNPHVPTPGENLESRNEDLEELEDELAPDPQDPS